MIQRGFNIFGCGDHALHATAQHVTKTVERLDIQRIAQRHGDRVVVFVYRHHFVPARDFAWNQIDDFLLDLHTGERDVLHAKLVRERLEHVGFGGDMKIDEGVNDRLVVLFGPG